MRLLHLGPLALSAAASGLLAFAACSDSLHLSPEPTPGTGPGTGGAGGNAPSPCTSSRDCVFPESVCDALKGYCVQCVEHEDCSFQPGTVCSEAACVCPDPAQAFCGELGKPGAPGYQAARCVDLTRTTTDCGLCGKACFGACAESACVEPWEQTSLVDAPAPRSNHTAVWTGTQMIVWGGDVAGGGYTDTGGIYDPATRRWTPTSLVDAPSPRRRHTAVWDDVNARMILWGGENGSPLGDGAAYDPATNTWDKLPGAGAPQPRYVHTAVWNDARMIVWGGTGASGNLGDGALYDPAMGQWIAMASFDARREHTAVWTGTRMLVFGGFGIPPGDIVENYLAYTAEYNPATDSWLQLDPTGEPAARQDHTAVWTGTAMLVWGGTNGTALADGAEHNGTSWGTAIPATPAARVDHTAVWIGAPVDKMIIWGGETPPLLATGALYSPGGTWDVEMPTAPMARARHTAVAADTRMILWGGSTPAGLTNTGAIFDAAPPASP